MNTPRLPGRWPISMLPAVALIAVVAGCGWFGGDDAVETTGQTNAVDQPGTNAVDQPGTNVGGSDGDAPEQVALGEITDPSESHDPDASTPDTAPESQNQRTRSRIHLDLEAGEWLLADQRATEALERPDLEPDFRLELEAYQDLARAADSGDDVATDAAIDRLQQLQPEFVRDLTVRPVLPAESAGIEPSAASRTVTVPALDPAADLTLDPTVDPTFEPTTVPPLAPTVDALAESEVDAMTRATEWSIPLDGP